MVAGELITEKLQYLLTLYGAALDYVMRTLQVQQMAAARAVLGRCSCRWSNVRILASLVWLNIRRFYVSSLLNLNKKIVTTKKPLNIYNIRAATGNELRARARAGTVRAGNRTAFTYHTFNNQAIKYYNKIRPEMQK